MKKPASHNPMKKIHRTMNKKILIPVVGTLALLVGGLIVSLLLSGPRMQHHPSLEAYEAELNQPPEDAVAFGREEISPANMEIPEPTEENMSRGKTYYNYYCVFCHGEQGEGHGPVGQSYVPKPADLHADSIRQKDKEALYRAIFQGPGHEPVMDRIVKPSHRKYIMMYIRNEFR